MLSERLYSRFLIGTVIGFVIVTLSACASLSIPAPQTADSTLLAFPFSAVNESDSGNAPGFEYIYEIESLDGKVDPYRVVFSHQLDGDLLIVDSLPPGPYRVSKLSVAPLGAGSHSYNDNSVTRNDQFQLEAGKLLVFSQSLNIRKYNSTPGRGRSIVFERSIEPLSITQRDQITETLQGLPNFDQWELQFAVAGTRLNIPASSLSPAPATTFAEQPGEIDVSGRYRSRIVSDSDFVFPPRFQQTEITLRQSGKQISGVDASGEFQITGEVVDNRVRYYLQPTIATGYYDVNGEWLVQKNGKSLTGFWKDSRGDGPGQWSLTRIE